MRFSLLNSALLLLAVTTQSVQAGPLAYAVCQAGYSAVVVACYSAAGFTFGTVTAGAAIPIALVKCNAAYGACQAACATAALFAPTP
ncbi:hypothetical protein NBRC10512_006799 [Rhodotorula toruloides]|uniref:RHTO0S05e04324g1_1 n=2 Tax=Rhodotorula toruloides TaxID=5286 RepID=A0A061B0K7_RHOTO|nr:uncharacterized protein RHTO_07020 [Rhodotorula toruloides NP11]EMS23961.1 hypothetical protein RHTO_07020 [Rhodotorula toruloides NP11]CDR40505.1 RHTO0S05e04324g1_1 [Rhodotorula toruloides]